MKKYLFVFLFCLPVQMLFSQVKRPKNKADMIAICDQFMDTFEKGKYQEAFDQLKPYTVVEDYKLDTLAATAVIQMQRFIKAYGKVVAYEQSYEKPVKSVSRLTYLLKFEKLYLKIRIIIYNNGEGWTITSFKWDDDIEDMFQ